MHTITVASCWVKFTDSFRSTNIHLKEVEKPACASYLCRKPEPPEEIQLGQFYRSCSSVKGGGCRGSANLSPCRSEKISSLIRHFCLPVFFVEFQMAGWCDTHSATVIPDDGFSSSNKSCRYPCEICLNRQAHQQKPCTSQSNGLP